MIDFMAIGAHADDVELMAGGTVIRMVEMGKKGVVVDMTDASAGTRGNSLIRAEEANKAAVVMGVERVNLGFADAGLENNFEIQSAVIGLIRRFQPKILLTHHIEDEHPDHIATAHIVKTAKFKSGLKNLDLPGTPFRPQRVFHFMGPVYFEPSFCVDISNTWDKKMESVMCYESQFFNEKMDSFMGKTDIASPEFLTYLEHKHRFFGWRIKRTYAEPFFCQELPEISDLTQLGGKRF